MKQWARLLLVFLLCTGGCRGGGLSWKFVKRDIAKRYDDVPHMTVDTLAATNMSACLQVRWETLKSGI